MHEMNVLVTVFVLAALYIAVFYVVEKVFMQDKAGSLACAAFSLPLAASSCSQGAAPFPLPKP